MARKNYTSSNLGHDTPSDISRNIPRRRFGRTDISMPVLSTGFMRSMYSWDRIPECKIPIESQEAMDRVVSRALELGINHFETARGYGTSEQQLGRALRLFPRNSYILQTKIQPAENPEEFTTLFLDSLRTLGVEYVDLLCLHGINDHRSFWYSCRENGCLAAARRLVKKGKARHVGFSSHGETEILLEAIRHQEDGGFDYANIHWYYISQRHRSAIAEAHERDKGIFIISPTDKGGMLYKPPPKLVQLSDPISPILFNDLYCLSQKEVTTISVGAARPSDFDEHVSVLPFLNNQSGLLDLIDERWRQAMLEATGYSRPDALWDTLPSWEITPGYINIPFILWLFNLLRGWDLHTYARNRYQGLGRDMPWIPGNNAADVDSYNFREVLQGSEMSDRETSALLKEAHKMLS